MIVGDEVSGLLIAADRYLSLGCYDDAFELASRAREQRFTRRRSAFSVWSTCIVATSPRPCAISTRPSPMPLFSKD